jgi:NADH dehydrogenase/NADH:ubiquinone oxidoreductase subunit G
MKTITLQIDGKPVVVAEGMTVLDAARSAGIEIPTLCDSKEIKPAGACRMCMVEVTKGTRKRLVASCVYPVEEGIQVVTENDRIVKNRKLIVELLWPSWTALGKSMGVTSSRFEPGLSECSLCGLCVRYCTQVAKKNVVYFRGRGIDRHLAFVPGSENECSSCRQCHNLCSGGWIVTHQGTVEAD